MALPNAPERRIHDYLMQAPAARATCEALLDQHPEHQIVFDEPDQERGEVLTRRLLVRLTPTSPPSHWIDEDGALHSIEKEAAPWLTS